VLESCHKKTKNKANPLKVAQKYGQVINLLTQQDRKLTRRTRKYWYSSTCRGHSGRFWHQCDCWRLT